MTPAATSATLPGGLVLRSARPDDLGAIGALLAERGEPQDALDHRLVVQDPDLGWPACAVVVDGERVVCTATLLDETVRVGDVTLPAGQVDLVATDPGYEGRGLVRALMGWAHARSAARGHLLQVMVGIPYFYRLFGYSYAIDIPPARPLLPGAVRTRTAAASTAARTGAAETLRVAVPGDLPALASLQDAAQAVVDVAVPHPEARRRWLLAHESSTTWVLERDGAVVASARAMADDGALLVAEPAAADAAAAHGLLAALLAPGGPGACAPDGLSVVHRAGTVTGQAWDPLLGPAPDGAEQYYVRIAQPERVLDAMRPLLRARLERADLLGTDRELLLCTYRAQYRLPLRGGELGPVVIGGVLQAPGAAGGVGVPPDLVPGLLLGPLGLLGLARRHADVVRGQHADLYQALFPPLTADLLTYYLPW